MRSKTIRWTLTAALAAVLLTLACAKPADESWFRITAFKATNGDSLAAFPSGLHDKKTDYVDVVLTNFSTNSQDNPPGTGISIHRVRVSYVFGNYTAAIPAYDYAMAYYLPSGDGDAGSVVTIQDLPLVPVNLKGWFLNPGNVPGSITCCPFPIQAVVTVYGRTFAGRSLETTSGLTITFSRTEEPEEEPPPEDPPS